MRFNEQQIYSIIRDAENSLCAEFQRLDDISLSNQEKVLSAFQGNKVSLRHFAPTTGYGYGDEGRDVLKKIYADVFHAESAIVSPNIVSGTHAISLALYAILKKGDKVLSVSGTPYDTLHGVIFGEGMTLEGLGISFDCIDLLDSNFDLNKILDFFKNNRVDMIYIQRSRGYCERSAISVSQIEKLVRFVRKNGFQGCIFVDNCYGEFVEKNEPTDLGADVVAGSLIKNIGGGLAPTGGYIAGKSKYINKVDSRLTAPSICGEVGSYAFGYQYFYQGLFIAPHTVNQALKGSLLLGFVLNFLGYETIPKIDETPFDITRSVRLKTENALINFIQSIQNVSPVDSYLKCEAWEMPGYNSPVIMAAGCFIQGSSIELSADAPIKPPYIAYVQGGLTIEHSKIAIKEFLKTL